MILAVCTDYYGFRDHTTIVQSDNWYELAGIADHPAFRLWAINAGFQYFGIWKGCVGRWDYLGNPVHLELQANGIVT